LISPDLLPKLGPPDDGPFSLLAVFVRASNLTLGVLDEPNWYYVELFQLQQV